MKKLILVGLMLITACAFAQKIDVSKVPATVKKSFDKAFPGVKTSKWEIEKKDYEANFTQNGKKMSALFSADGKWLETETDINISALPATVTKYLAANYKAEKVKEAAMIEKADGSTNYEAEVKGQDLIFDKGGNFIKAVKD
ncbi:MAG: PepSY-like domain-containing protein [Bacteroidetes bacterium]|nr:PepSY-like domain-containing protein [Bacteroidota bacterium]